MEEALANFTKAENLQDMHMCEPCNMEVQAAVNWDTSKKPNDLFIKYSQNLNFQMYMREACGWGSQLFTNFTLSSSILETIASVDITHAL